MFFNRFTSQEMPASSEECYDPFAEASDEMGNVTLPEELIVETMSWLDPAARKACTEVSHRWKNFANDKQVLVNSGVVAKLHRTYHDVISELLYQFIITTMYPTITTQAEEGNPFVIYPEINAKSNQVTAWLYRFNWGSVDYEGRIADQLLRYANKNWTEEELEALSRSNDLLQLFKSSPIPRRYMTYRDYMGYSDECYTSEPQSKRNIILAIIEPHRAKFAASFITANILRHGLEAPKRYHELSNLNESLSILDCKINLAERYLEYYSVRKTGFIERWEKAAGPGASNNPLESLGALPAIAGVVLAAVYLGPLLPTAAAVIVCFAMLITLQLLTQFIIHNVLYLRVKVQLSRCQSRYEQARDDIKDLMPLPGTLKDRSEETLISENDDTAPTASPPHRFTCCSGPR